MLKADCLYCNTRFSFYPSQHRQFCSMNCYQQWRLKNRIFIGLEKATAVKTLKPKLDISPNLLYVVGALKGDGWTIIEKRVNGTSWKIKLAAGLSETFATEFAGALKPLGLNSSVHLQSQNRPDRSPVWIVTANSKLFVQWYRILDSELLGGNLETPELAASFLKGVYEAEGSIWKIRGYAQCNIVNKSSEFILLCLNALDTLCLNYSVGEYAAKYLIRIHPTIEAVRFVFLTKPCIKNELPIPRYKNNSAYQALGLPFQQPEERG